MTVTKLSGKVAEVLNERQLVINIGARDGVEAGMRFAVLGAKPIIIHDPDTGEELDALDPEKIRVQATVVRERVAICETYRSRVVRTGGGIFSSSLDWANLFSPSVRRREYETLRHDDLTAIPPPVDPTDSYVKPGDRVVQVVDPDEDGV
jgi:hypothetical protein